MLTVPVTELARAGSGGLRLVGDGDDGPLPLVVVGDLDWVPLGADVALLTAGDRTLQVVPQAPHLLLSSVTFGPDSVTVAGTAHGADRFTLRLAGDRVTGGACDVKVEEGVFEATVPTTFTFWDGSPTTLWRDVYRLEADADGSEATVRASSRLQHDAPGQSHGWRMRVSASRNLAFRRVKDLKAEQASAYGRQVLRRTVYLRARDVARRDAVVFESFAGTGTDDNPGAICRALLGQQGHGHELLWSVSDAAVPVPAGTRRLLQGTPEWFEALGSARFVVTNGALPPWFRKAPEQVVVQTWRGQPLRRLGPDVNDPRVLDEDDDVLVRQAAEWDLLASPSEFASRTLTSALGFRGRAIEVGSPRNDVLLSADTGRVRDDVRRRLGLRDDRLVVLYAPTYREYARVAGHHEKVLFLDPAELTARRPDVVLLVRGHAYTAAAPAVHGEQGRRRHDVPRRGRAVPGRRRAGHRLLLGRLRLRADRQADRAALARPGGVPARRTRTVRRPGRGSTGSARGHHGRGPRRPGPVAVGSRRRRRSRPPAAGCARPMARSRTAGQHNGCSPSCSGRAAVEWCGV